MKNIKVMNQCIKYFSALNLINLAYHIVGNKLVNTGDSNFEASFERLFKWRSLKYGFQEAKVSNKPIFLLIYKLQCPSCQKLKQNFSKSVRLMDLSDRYVSIRNNPYRFIMIKAEMESNATLNKKMFQPDGKYVPRILFFTSDGNFIEEAYNKHADADTEYKYFYKNPSQVINTMLFVLKSYSKEPMPVMFKQSLELESNNLEDDIFVPTIS